MLFRYDGRLVDYDTLVALMEKERKMVEKADREQRVAKMIEARKRNQKEGNKQND